jgi:hypothetical protein
LVAALDDKPSEDASPALPDPYEILSIRSVVAPSGTAGTNWHRYEISQGSNRIVGYRNGGIDNVTLEVEGIVLALNERRRPRRGRVQVVLRRTPPASTPDGAR